MAFILRLVVYLWLRRSGANNMILLWILIGLLLIVWGIVEWRRHLHRADETAESDLITQTDEEMEEWRQEYRKSISVKMGCILCNSKEHWGKDCPVNPEAAKHMRQRDND